jgi:hypothetical protein
MSVKEKEKRQKEKWKSQKRRTMTLTKNYSQYYNVSSAPMNYDLSVHLIYSTKVDPLVLS